MSDGRKLPIVISQYVGAGQVLFQATDETYRWSRSTSGNEPFARYWLQSIRGLARAKLRAGRSNAELTLDQQRYLPNDEVLVRVRFVGDIPAEPVVVQFESPAERRQATLTATATIRP